MALITLRPPSFSTAKPPPDYKSPTIAWLTETWHVTHSTLPMWKSKRNVRIQYTPLPPSSLSISQENTDRIDDVVSSQSLKGDKVSKIHGVDSLAVSSLSEESARDAWDWHGKGMLKLAGKLAASHWEILAYGEEGSTNKYVVTMFAKTLFTPAGIDLYSQGSGGLAASTVEDIKKALAAVEDEGVRKLAGELFQVKMDGNRKD